MLAAVLALAASVAVGAAVVAQQRATHEVRARGVDGGRSLMVAVYRQPWWVAGTGASVVASCLQAAALTRGPVVVVQALLAAAVAWAAVLEALLARRRPSPSTVVGIGLAVAGPVAVVVLLGPVTATGTPVPGPAALLPLIVGFLVAAAALVRARRHPGPRGAPGLALAAGVGYGLTAALLAAVARAASTDLTGALADPVVLLAAATLIVVGPASFVASQHALARARRAGPTLTIILLTDPVAAAVSGSVWFGEHVPLDTASAAGILAAVVVAAAGIRLLSGDDHDRTPEPARGSPPRR